MQTATRKDADHVAGAAFPSAFPATDALLSELGVVYPVMAFTGPEGDAPQADAWEAPSGSPGAQASEERRSEMDARIMAGLVRA